MVMLTAWNICGLGIRTRRLNINWIVCGGSGFNLRRQRPEGPELTESYGTDGKTVK